MYKYRVLSFDQRDGVAKIEEHLNALAATGFRVISTVTLVPTGYNDNAEIVYTLETKV